MIHKLKLKNEFADAVLSGEKPFEIRYNDRNYQKGDEIQFTVIDDEGEEVEHPVDKCGFAITYVLSGWGLKDGYVALGIANMPF